MSPLEAFGTITALILGYAACALGIFWLVGIVFKIINQLFK